MFGPRVKPVANMQEFFKTDFGKKLQASSIKTKQIAPSQGQSIYEATEKIPGYKTKKGFKYYLDGKHKDHLETFIKNGMTESVLNLDVTLNVRKTNKSFKEGRSI